MHDTLYFLCIMWSCASCDPHQHTLKTFAATTLRTKRIYLRLRFFFFLSMVCISGKFCCRSWVLHQRSVCCRPVWNSSPSVAVCSLPSLSGPVCIMKLCAALWFWTHIRQHLYVQLHMPGDAVLTTSYFQPRWVGLQPKRVHKQADETTI